MLSIQQQKHIALFDYNQSYFSSFCFTFKSIQKEYQPQTQQQLSITLKIANKFTFEWKSDLFDITIQNRKPNFGSMPFSLETYCLIYQDPTKIKFKLTPKSDKVNQDTNLGNFNDKFIGKLIIKTIFRGNPFILPVQTIGQQFACSKKITAIIQKDGNQSVLCSCQQKSLIVAQQVTNFVRDPDTIDSSFQDSTQKLTQKQKNAQNKHRQQKSFLIYSFQGDSRVNQKHIALMKGQFTKIQFVYDCMTISIFSVKENIQFIPNLKESLSKIKSHMDLSDLTIIQGVKTEISDTYRMIFYKDTLSVYESIFRSYLYDKVCDKWIIEGIVQYNRNPKDYQDSMAKLADLISQGEEFYPLINEQYSFDKVWQIKAKVIYHILANLKSIADRGGRSLTTFLVQLSKKIKVNSLYLFKKLKNKYGLDSIKKIYYEQFIISTGLNKIFYELVNVPKQNCIKIIIRQKAQACKLFKVYNMFRIKLEQNYEMISPLTEKIMKKNHYDEKVRKKELSGPLCVPKFIKCVPYFYGKLIIQVQGSQPFDFQLLGQNMMEKTKQSSTLRSKRTLNRKNNQLDNQLFTWIMVDTAEIFPAIYSNSNVPDQVIEYMLKKQYQNQVEQLKVLNAISARDHTGNQNISKIMLEKLKMKPPRQNASLNIKRKILSILPFFLNKAKDTQIWQKLLGFLKLYEPPCYDFSEEGSYFLQSLIECIGQISYRKDYSYYFEQFHRILLSISKYHRINSQNRQEQLRKIICQAIMNWESIYSFQIIAEMKELLLLCKVNVVKHPELISIIIQKILKYFQDLKIKPGQTRLIQEIEDIIQYLIDKDYYGQLYAIKFFYQTKVVENKEKPIQFLNKTFQRLESIQENPNLRKSYPYCLQKFKNILNDKKKRYGLQIQINELNKDQNYFLAQYIWKHMCSELALKNARIRLNWIKIYRIFYFYYTPIITFVKIKENCQDPLRSQFRLSKQALNQVRLNIIDFNPDIGWFSVYDSSSKAHKKEVEKLQDRKRTRKPQEIILSEKNLITKYIKETGKHSWEQLSRQALKWIVANYDDKDSENPTEQKYKQIVQGLKNISNYLKRGNTPPDYNFQKLKRDAIRVLESHDQENEDVLTIFQMVENALEQIQQRKRQKQYQKDGTKIMLPKLFEDEEQNK